MTITVTADVAIEKLREIVAEYGSDHVYTDACTYERYGAPSCLVGHVLYRLGVDAATLYNLDNPEHESDDTKIATLASEGVLGQNDVEMDAVATALLGIAQSVQDDRLPWGLALNRAEDHYKALK